MKNFVIVTIRNIRKQNRGMGVNIQKYKGIRRNNKKMICT
jgi:hypothetical protein